MGRRSDRSGGIYELAEQCGVGIGAACDLAQIARSTPPRWRRGFVPRPGHLARLRSCVLRLAAEHGTLPRELAHELAAPALPSAEVLDEVRTMRAALDRIEASLCKRQVKVR